MAEAARQGCGRGQHPVVILMEPLEGHRLVSGENHCSREVSRMVEVGMGQRSQKRWVEPSGNYFPKMALEMAWSG